MWTCFMDMHSGGGTKEPPYEYIYIEAAEDEAKLIFYNRFGHSPARVSCTCCGSDYSIDEAETLAEGTGSERNCRWATPTKGEGRYFEVDESIPEGWVKQAAYGTYRTLDEWRCEKTVLIVEKKDIKADETWGQVPEQGYVWMG